MASPVTVNVGHKVACSYMITDQNGNDLLVQPPLVQPATWTDAPSPAGVDTSAVSADGTTDLVTAVAAGQDTVGLSVVVNVGGANQTFTDSAMITIAAAPQVPSGVRIVAVVQ